RRLMVVRLPAAGAPTTSAACECHPRTISAASPRPCTRPPRRTPTLRGASTATLNHDEPRKPGNSPGHTAGAPRTEQSDLSSGHPRRAVRRVAELILQRPGAVGRDGFTATGDETDRPSEGLDGFPETPDRERAAGRACRGGEEAACPLPAARDGGGKLLIRA